MGKKSKSKVPKEVKDNADTVIEEKPLSSRKKPTSEIDDIFAGKGKKKPQPEKARNPKEENPSSSAKKPANVIDGSFTGLERKRPESRKAKRPSTDVSESANKLKRKEADRGLKDGGFEDRCSRPKKRTADGFVIYTEDELGFNKEDAGNTRLCPFDCECCF